MNKNSRIYVAGHSGFVGGAVTRKLKNLGFKNLIVRTHNELDLADQRKVNNFFKDLRPEYIFLMAAKVGGIYANKTYPADFIYQNISIQTNVIHAAYEYGAKKLLFPGSACMYPKYCSQPIKEEYLFTGLIEPTNEPFAAAKIAGVKMCQSYNRQYKTNFISVVPATIYGPRDHFDDNGHVASGLIQKFHNGSANKDRVVKIWGTGRPKREFIYIDDVSRALIFSMNHYSGPELVNIGSGEEVSVRRLAEMVKTLASFKGDIEFQKNKLDGIPRRLLDSSRIFNLGWRPKVSLEEGLKITYKWYEDNSKKIYRR